MAELYRSALRSCYYKSYLGGKAPNSSDPLHVEFHQLRQRADRHFIELIVLGIPLIYFAYYKLIVPRFPAQTFKSSLCLSAISVTYILGAAFVGYDRDSDEKLTQLAWKYESDLTLLCPDVKTYASGKTDQPNN